MRRSSRLLAQALLVLSVVALTTLTVLRRAALLPWRLDQTAWTGASGAHRAAAVVVPATVVIGTHAAFGSLTSPLYLAWTAATFAAAVLGALVVIRGLRARTGAPLPTSAAVAASVAGPHLVGVLPLLAATAWRGPVGAWTGFWLDPTARAAFVVAAVVAVAWLLMAPGLSGIVGSRRGATSLGLAAAAAPLLWLGGLAVIVGQERLLTGLNDEMQVVPGGLSRILGLTVHLGVPPQLPLVAVSLGALLAAFALALLASRPGRGNRAGPVASPQPPPASTASATANHSVSS